MKATKKVLSLLLAFTLSMGLAAPAMAYNSEGSQVDEAGTVTGQDMAQEVHSEYDTYGLEDGHEASEHVTQVYVTKESIFSVRIPKTIILSGNGEHSGQYVLQVKGDLTDDDIISITPRETEIALNMVTGKKAPITAIVTQEKTEITGAEVGKSWTNLSEGTIKAPDLKAGSWQGTMVFDIAIDKVSKMEYTPFTVTKDNRAKIGYQGIENEELVIPYAFQDEDGIWYKVTSIGNNAFTNTPCH